MRTLASVLGLLVLLPVAAIGRILWQSERTFADVNSTFDLTIDQRKQTG